MKVDFSQQEKKKLFSKSIVLTIKVQFTEEEKHLIQANDLEKYPIHYEENDLYKISVRLFFDKPVDIEIFKTQAQVNFAKERILHDLKQLSDFLKTAHDPGQESHEL